MGLDLLSFPVRLESAPMRRIRRDAQAWEDARTYPPFSCYAVDRSLSDISLELLAEHPPGLERGWPLHFPDRSHQQAEYVLDPAGYEALNGWIERERTLPYRTIYGDQVFADHARAGQGHSWRCSTNAFLTEAAARIDAIDHAATRRQFSVARMEAAGLYKVHPDEDDSDAFERIMGNLRQFAAYYHEIIDKGLDLILIIG